MKTTRLVAAAALLAASGAAFAHSGYYVPGPVVGSDPAFMISIGTPGFSMAYGTGAYGYYGPPPYYAAPYYPPARVIVAPPPYRGKHAYRYYGPDYRGPARVPYGPPPYWDDDRRH